MSDQKSIAPVWEEIYSNGLQQNKYPWDSVVSFVFRNMPTDLHRKDIRILEVGFGSGGNLWFAAREGFSVSGIEGSESAVQVAKERFINDSLDGDLRVGDFADIPFKCDTFHLVIDRAALVCVGKRAQQKAVNEIHRVLKCGGKLLHQTYATRHTSFNSGVEGPDGVTIEISSGNLVGVGQLCFSSKEDIQNLFAKGWEIEEAQLREWKETLHPDGELHAEWFVVAKKIK